ncbi:hypothetical protein L596_005817 [Steinernema carpocapsae]|uniref:Potassium channel domain-containing protein n=1 Tax=Steinernema carpocapsae TaxID=34508 RepID=A0A4U8V649_STECR|nr:hypothetical protein L596_005817 [Steinernema carpocapsae]
MFIPRLRLALSGASPFLVHVFLVVSVVLYIVFGAVMMQFFEGSANDTDTSPEVYPTKPITYKMEPIATWETAALTQDLTGSDLASEDPNVHICIQRVLESLMNSTKCLEHEVDLYILNPIDECYQNAVFVVEQKQKEIKHVKQFGKKGRLMKEFLERLRRNEFLDSEDVEIIEEQWTFTNAVIFAFTVITTIGYGHIAPVTFEGRLFCIVYGLIGVPFTLLTIADIGMFLSRLLRLIVKAITFIINWAKSIRREGLFNMVLRRKVSRIWLTEVPIESPTKEPLQTESQNDEEERDHGESIGLSITFVIYLLVGAYLLSLYEPEMDYFKAFYFNFVTLTTIGLGDFVPRSNNYIFLTLIYITVGLALTTLATSHRDCCRVSQKTPLLWPKNRRCGRS